MSKGTCPTLLAVDPATRSGWAWYDGGKLRDFGAVTTAGGEPRALLTSLGASPPQPVLVIEEHTNPRNRRTSRLLIEARMRWEVPALELGWTIERVNSQTWQRCMVGLGTSAQRKAHAIALALSLVHRDLKPGNARRPNADEADAICLGSYWLRTAGKP
jgi:hypothetical protein